MDRTDQAGAVVDGPGAASTGHFAGNAERAVDEVLAAYDGRRLRLWVANFADRREEVDEFREWGGVVRITTEGFLAHWHPDRARLLERVSRRAAGGVGFDAAAEELLPLAREDLAGELVAKHVPPKLAERAKGFILPTPPMQQWKM